MNRTPDFTQTRETTYLSLILEVRPKSSSELKKHTHGPGERYVFSDHENNPKGQIYAITRVVENVDNPPGHIEDHSHATDSLWMFEGSNLDLTGLEVEIKLGEHTQRLKSPASVYIPAGVVHNYRFIRGSGHYTNIVIAPGGDYNQTLRP